MAKAVFMMSVKTAIALPGLVFTALGAGALRQMKLPEDRTVVQEALQIALDRWYAELVVLTNWGLATAKLHAEQYAEHPLSVWIQNSKAFERAGELVPICEGIIASPSFKPAVAAAWAFTVICTAMVVFRAVCRLFSSCRSRPVVSETKEAPATASGSSADTTKRMGRMDSPAKPRAPLGKVQVPQESDREMMLLSVLNHGTHDDIASFEGVSGKSAQSIISHREKAGLFNKMADLDSVGVVGLRSRIMRNNGA